MVFRITSYNVCYTKLLRIRITGIVRAEDVQADNTVESQRVADARIYYGGTGDFANTQERGWLAQFFNSPWSPF